MQKSKIKNQNVGDNVRRSEHWFNNFAFCILHFDRKPKGFTLLEMVVSIGIFTVVIIVSISVLVALKGAQSKSSRLQIVQDTVRFTLEEITGRLRGGTDYAASGCDANGCHNINFTLANTAYSFWYCWDQATGAIYTQYYNKLSDPPKNCSSWTSADRITSPDVIVANLNFLVHPSSSVDQAMVTVTMQAQARDPRIASPDTQMNLQSTVTRRKRQ